MARALALPASPLRRWRSGLLASCALALAQAAVAAPLSTLRLGIHNGLLDAPPIEVDTMARAVASQLAKIAGRPVEFEVNYGGSAIGKSLQQPGHFDLALARPGNLTAALLGKGWTLLADGRDPAQGVNFIAQSCPGKPGQVLLGGPSLLLLNIHNPPAQTCMNAADVWKAPQLWFLTAARGSLVDLVTRRVVQEHGGDLSHVINTGTQSTVPDFMNTMHVAIVGAVSPRFSGQWVKGGGALVFHQPMPPLAILAAPELASETTAALRSGLGDPANAVPIARALEIPGLDSPDPRPYQAFTQWLRNGEAPARP